MTKVAFTDLNLSKEVLQATVDMGFTHASPIQAQAIPHLLQGCDLIGQAMTGTGKTAAFGIPAIEKVDANDRAVQVLVLCPTRELAIQVASEMVKLSKFKRNVTTLPIYGGQPIDVQIRGLRRGAQIVVGTPGRVMDLMDRGLLSFAKVGTVILDEADEMLNMGFREDIEFILKDIKQSKQVVLFSATMSPAILRLTKLFQNNPTMIKVASEKITVPTVEQHYYEVESHNKNELLMRLIDVQDQELSIVFCNTKHKVDDVAKVLRMNGYRAEGIHGDVRQAKRDKIMGKFRGDRISVLVATDVAARGIDVSDVMMVINYDIPMEPESYVHRIGRTGRAGKAGKAISFVAKKDFYKFNIIRRFTQVNIMMQQIPSARQARESQADKLVTRVKMSIDKKDYGHYAPIVEKLLAQNHSAVDVASALLKMVSETTHKQF
jgi:ATP-dependent RNA helicase DeaD